MSDLYFTDGTYNDYDQTGGAHVCDYMTWKWLIHWQKAGVWGEGNLIDWGAPFWCKDGYYEQ